MTTSNHQIEDYLKKHPNFLGCFPHDKLPPLPSIGSIINNTDSGRGEH